MTVVPTDLPVTTTLPGEEAVASRLVHRRADGVSLVLLLDADGGRLPRVVHWGADLGVLAPGDLAGLLAAVAPAPDEHPTDVARVPCLVPEHADGWVGRPGVEGSRDGRDWSPVLRVRATAEEVADDGTYRLVTTAADPVAGLALELELELAPSGLLRTRATLADEAPEGETPFRVDALRLVVPVPATADELLDFTGRHTLERVPQRQPFTAGLHAREVRSGRTGLDGVHVLAAGRTGFANRTGDVWGVHLGWSGNAETYAERHPTGVRVLGAGELLVGGEVRLGPGRPYTSPWLHAVHGRGLDGLAGRFHAWLRARPQHPRRPRPVTLNTWEAVYFAHDLRRLTALADAAAEVGAERFVLDDGWFGSRRDDTSGLGDWTVSADAWPQGLGPLVDHVRGLGLEFGLWVEPEMVNLDSDLARAHPEWLLRAGGRTGAPARNQHVLDLAQPGAFEHVRSHLDALLRTYDIAYLKWDHNRLLVDAGSGPLGTPGVHAQTEAAYRLVDVLKEAHPGLEVESCASGGGRVDLGVLARTDRVWASDCNDALDRQAIQRWTQLLLPPELVGAHVGPPRSHTTGRTHDLSFRAGTALFGHLGAEWDIASASAEERAELARWVALHRELRPLLHGGVVVNADVPDPALAVHGVVAPDGSDALFALVALGRPVTVTPGRVALPGLAPERRYAVRLQAPGDDPGTRWTPPWCAEGVTTAGAALGTVGLQVPPLEPEHLVLVRVTAVG